MAGGCTDNEEPTRREARPRETPPCEREYGCVIIAPDEPIQIGTLLSLSREKADLGRDAQDGAHLAADFLSPPGEILGHPILWVDKDDECRAEGKENTHELALDPDTVAVIGTTCDNAALGVADTILSDKGIVLISPSNTGPALTDPAIHQPFYLRTAHNDKLQGAAVANFAFIRAGWKTASTIHDGSPYADGLQQAFSDTFTANGGTITKQEAVQIGNRSFRPLLKDSAADKIDGLYFPISVTEAGLITAQARTVPGLAETELAGSDTMFTPDWINSAGPNNSEGVYISAPDLTTFQEGRFYRREVLPAFEGKFGKKPTSPAHAYAFDAATLVLKAIADVAMTTADGGMLIPRTGLRDALYETRNYPGITGTLRCDINGDCQAEGAMAIYQVRDGDFGKPIFQQTVRLEDL